ncbi:hypothetical protein HK100_004200, partial [Physocladia obscura]
MPSLPPLDIEAKIKGLDTAEKKEQLAFQWLSAVERELNKLYNDAKPQDPTYVTAVEKTLTAFISSGNGLPRPSRPIRETVARIFVLVYSKGDTRLLSDTVSALQSILLVKKFDEPAVKLAAIYCLGSITENVGSKVSYMFSESSTILLKVLKTARDSEISIRHEIFVAFSAFLRGMGKSVTDSLWKDLIKYGKAGLTDKAALIRSDAANVNRKLLENLYRYSGAPKPSTIDEFDSFIALAIKGIDGANSTARISISKFIGFLVSTSQMKVENTVKPGTKVVVGDVAIVEDEGILSVEEMLNLLQGYFVKSASKEIRVGVIQFYAEVLRELGIGFIESNYSRIVKHLTLLVGLPKFTAVETEGIHHRNLCSFLIRDVVGKTLSESGQISALRELESGWLKKWSSLFGPESPSSKWVLTFILDEIAALLIDLGSASSVVADVLSNSLFNLLNFPSPSVNASLSLCLKIFSNANPKILSTYLDRLIDILKKDSLSLTGEKPDVLEKFIGYGNALSAVLSAVKNHRLNASFESLAVIFGISTQLIKASASAKDTKVAIVQAQMAWSILAGMTSLGPTIMTVHMSQLFLLWKAVFPKTIAKEVTDSDLALILSLLNRDQALSSINTFLKFNKSLITSDISKRVVVLLNNALSCSTSIRASSALNTYSATASPVQKKIQEMELSVRKRIFDCFHRVKPVATFESSFVLLLKTTAAVFAPDHEVNAEKAVQEKSNSVLDISILTSLLWKELEFCGSNENRSGISILSLRDFDLQRLEQLTEPRVFGAFENDPSTLILQDSNIGTPPILPMPTTVAAVDSAIILFSLLFPIQSALHQEAILEQFSKTVKYIGPKVSAARKLSVQLNIFIAIIFALKSIIAKNGGLASERVPITIRDLVL